MEPNENSTAHETLDAPAKSSPATLAGPIPERRQRPRFQVRTDDRWINEVADFTVRDVSTAGMGITAEFPLAPGMHISVLLGEDVSKAAVVVRCQLVESASQYWPPLFHISCRFAELSAG